MESAQSLAEAFVCCPRCGHALEMLADSPRCPACQLTLFRNPCPTTAAILTNERGEILLTRRGRAPFKMMWDFPGGFVVPGETLEAGLQREMQEELHTTAEGLSYLVSLAGEYPYEGIIYPVLDCFFRGVLPRGISFLPDDDVAGYAFFAKADIPWDDLMSDRHRKALTLFFDQAMGG